MTGTTLFGTEMPVLAADEEVWISDDQLEDNSTEEPEKDDVLPNENQYNYQKEELAAFCHFGPNTFNEIEWGENYGSKTPNEIFKLTKDFDAEMLVSAIKDAGFHKLIVTAKHHDGFCIWASDHTTYDVDAATNYPTVNEDGERDILAEISAACTEYDIDMGLYLSPWDIHDDSYGYYDAEGNSLLDNNGNPLNGMTWEQVEEADVKDYNDYYNDQLEEILGDDKYGNDGHFVEVWMDGAKGSGASAQNYDFERWFDTIQKHEGRASGEYKSDCMLFGAEAYTTVRWIGNENGYADKNTWSKSRVNYDNNTIDSNSQGGYTLGWEDGNQWTVPEADARITSGWFWGTTKAAPKSIEALGTMYFNSVGHNAPLLLNIPPNDQGTVDDAILQRVAEFGENIRETFETNMAAAEEAEVTASEVRGNDTAFKPGNTVDNDDQTYWTTSDGENSGSLLINLGSAKKFDVVSIEEAIQNGQRINHYKVEYRNGSGDWTLLDEGETIGAKRLVRTSAVTADQVKITVETTDDKVPMISEVGVYKASEGFELAASAPTGMDVIDIEDTDTSDGTGFAFTGTWTQETGTNFVNETNRWANAGASLTLNFTGTKVYLVGTKDPNHGTATISIDGGTPVTVDTYATERSTGQIWFSSEDLDDGPHTLTLNVATKAIGIEAAYVINNGGLGMIGLEADEYTMSEDETMNVKITRVGGTNGRIKAYLSPNPGSAIQDDFYTEPTVVTFADGEKEITVPVTTRRNTNTTGTQDFTIELNSPSSGLILGFIDTATVNIIDAESMTNEQLQGLYDSVKDWDESLYTGDWNTFAKARAAVQALLEEEDPDALEMSQAYSTLEKAMEGLAERTAFTAEDPVVLPTKQGETVTAEAEFLTLDSTGASSGKEIRIIGDDEGENSTGSNGQHVGWFENGNTLTMHYYAPKAGAYNITVTYASGRGAADKNNITFANEDGTSVFEEFQQTEESDWGTVWQTRNFVLTVNNPGVGQLKMTTTNGAPNLDKFEISPAEGTYTYDVTATAGKGGSISPEGVTSVDQNGSQEYTIIPNSGYKISKVLVDEDNVTENVTVDENGAGTYTVSGVTADTTITAEFELANYTAENRFEFPTKVADDEDADGATVTLEAEYLVLDFSEAEEDKEIRVSEEKTGSSNDKCIDYFEVGNKAYIYYYAEKTGTYTVTLRYASGRPEDNRNDVTFTEENSNITEITQYFTQTNENDWGTVWQDMTFEFEVTNPGPGMIELTTENGGPILDKFDIALTEETGTLADELYKVDLEIAIQDAAKELNADADNTYTADSVTKLREALSAAQTVFNNGAATQSEVDEKLQDLEDAIDGLTLQAFVITAEVAGQVGGKIEASEATVDRGESVDFTITPDYGYTATKISVNGTEIASDSTQNSNFYGPNGTYSISNVTENQNVVVTFEESGYTEEEPFAFPTDDNPVTLQAEDFTLFNTGGLAERWKLCVSDGTWDGQMQFINSLNNGDRISVPYTAEAGVYDVTVYYRSGSQNNGLTWSSEGDKITAGSTAAGSQDQDSSVTRNTTFTVTVAESGAGIWTFTAPAGDSPQIDRFVITKQQDEPEPQTYKVTASVDGGNGTVTPESQTVEAGDDITFTIAPNEGYEIADVTVNDTSVINDVNKEAGTYTLENINEAKTVVVTFKKIEEAQPEPDQYTEENPFEFPTELNGTVTLEAEKMILNNTGDETEWYIQVGESEWASGGKYVNAMNAGDTAVLYYNADKAGTYEAELHYHSGDTANSMTWAESEGKIKSGELPSVEADENAANDYSVTLTWEVTTPGPGALTFTAGAENAPQLDKFDITLVKEAEQPVQTYTITASAGEGGSIDPSGEIKVNAGKSQTFTITANEGWHIKDVTVNGESKGAVASYEMSEAGTITAAFEKDEPEQPDRTALWNALQDAYAILEQTDTYTEASLADYKAVVDEVYAVYESDNATAESIALAITRLDEAKYLLEKLEKPPVTGEENKPSTGKPSGTQKPSDSNADTDKAVQTGDVDNPMLWIMLLVTAALSGAAWITMRQKSKRK